MECKTEKKEFKGTNLLTETFPHCALSVEDTSLI